MDLAKNANPQFEYNSVEENKDRLKEKVRMLAGGPGIEPGQPDPESDITRFFGVPLVSLPLKKCLFHDYDLAWSFIRHPPISCLMIAG